MNNMLYKALALGVLNILQLLFYNLRHPNRTSFGFVNLKKNLQPMNCKSISIWGCQKKKKKKTYFASSNTTLSILPTHFTTHHTSQFLFLYTTQ